MEIKLKEGEMPISLRFQSIQYQRMGDEKYRKSMQIKVQ